VVLSVPVIDDSTRAPATRAQAAGPRPRRVPVALRVILIVLGLLLASAIVGTIAGFRKSFSVDGVESMEPREKARILAEGISLAMNSMALAVLVAVVGGLILLGYWIATGKRRGGEER